MPSLSLLTALVETSDANPKLGTREGHQTPFWLTHAVELGLANEHPPRL